MYGVKQPGDGSFASNCLLARRLAERGVRFIQLYHRAWDHHGNIEQDMPVAAEDVDQACAALVKDLKQRGLLDDTLIIWGGEFGRTPMGQGSGRDHHILSFSIWMAGGGVKGGTATAIPMNSGTVFVRRAGSPRSRSARHHAQSLRPGSRPAHVQIPRVGREADRRRAGPVVREIIV